MKTRFLVADNVSVQQDGKLAAIGIYADNHLVLDARRHPNFAEELKQPGFSFGSDLDVVLTVSGLADGAHTGEIGVYQDGKLVVVAKPIPVSIDVQRSGSVNLILNFRPFALNRPGLVEFRLQVGEDTASEFLLVTFPEVV